MTYISGAPDPSDARAYMAGNLESITSHVDAERERQRLKLLRELYDAQQHQRKSQQQQNQPPPRLPVFSLPRGPVYWHATPAPIAGPAPVARHQFNSNTKRPDEDEHHAASSHAKPSVLTSGHGPAVKTSPERALHHEFRAGAIPGQPPQQERQVVSRKEQQSQSPVLLASPSTAVPSIASPPPLGTGRKTPTATVAFGGSGTPLRRGKWTKAEEEFAAATIQYFCGGLLNLQFGTLLRGFLAQQLHCHPMRISKKLLPGTTFCGVEISRKLGRRAYSPRWCDSPAATQQKLDAEDHLATLRLKFVASIEEEAEDQMDDGARASRDARLSEASTTDRQSRDSTARTMTPPPSVAGSPLSEARRTPDASPAAQQQQQPGYQQVAGLKRPREDSQWAAAEQRHYPQPPVYQQLSHHQPGYSQPSYSATATSVHQETELLRQHSAPPNWYPAAPTGVPSLYENAHRTAVSLPRLSYNPQPSFADSKPRENSSSPVRPLLPSLRASLERASSYQQQQLR